jgi:hypothetical protein
LVAFDEKDANGAPFADASRRHYRAGGRQACRIYLFESKDL